MSKPENPQAFPVACTDGVDLYEVPGMTLRDYFAGQALIGLLADGRANEASMKKLPAACFMLADAMLEARQKGGDA